MTLRRGSGGGAPAYSAPGAAAFAAARSFDAATVAAEAAALARVAPAGRCLDVGCGTGNYLSVLDHLTLGGHAVTAAFGIDPSPAMLGEAPHRLRGRLAAGRAEALPFADGAFDLLLLSHCQHLVDRRAAAAEAARVLIPGGRLLVLTLFPGDCPDLLLYRHAPETFAIDRGRMGTPETIAAEFAAHFTPARTLRHARRRVWAAAELAEAFLSGGLASTLARVPAPRREAIAAAILAGAPAPEETPVFTTLEFKLP